MPFEGRVVLVTGAGSGIGAGTARRFAAEGAMVALIGQGHDKMDAVAREMDPARTLVHVADVSQQAAVESAVAATVARFGRLDVLVNNAGIVRPGSLTEASVEDWRATMATDVDSVFYFCRAAVPHLLAQRGCIVNVSSVSGLGGDWGMSFYNAAKGAVTNFTRALALDLGPQGVRVNAVCPSFTRTGMTADMEKDTALMEKFKERIPLGRAAEPDDIAAVISFLASDDARFVTGVNLPVDGGLSASNGQPRLS
jgi:meso-butanediol dehydrogenase/(S,S)-butanediol dehydrogenase/diacetyl reductase